MDSQEVCKCKVFVHNWSFEVYYYAPTSVPVKDLRATSADYQIRPAKSDPAHHFRSSISAGSIVSGFRSLCGASDICVRHQIISLIA